MLKTKLHNVLCDLRCNTSTVMADDSALFQGGPLPDNYTPHLVNHAACARVAPSRKLSYICFEMTCVGERKAPPPPSAQEAKMQEPHQVRLYRPYWFAGLRLFSYCTVVGHYALASAYCRLFYRLFAPLHTGAHRTNGTQPHERKTKHDPLITSHFLIFSCALLLIAGSDSYLHRSTKVARMWNPTSLMHAGQAAALACSTTGRGP